MVPWLPEGRADRACQSQAASRAAECWGLPHPASSLCDQKLLLVELGKKVIGDNAEASLRAAAQMHAMNIRLTSAVDAVAAWFQSLEHYTKGDLLPLTPYQLGKSPGALSSYKAAKSGWCWAFIPCDLRVPDKVCLAIWL